MKVMSEGLQKIAGDRMRSILSKMTSRPLNGVLTGTLVTTVIQSSSATTVMTVSFASAGLLSLSGAIAVVMAAVITKENLNVSFVGVTATYVVGIVVTPLLSFALIGDAVNPLEILKYLILFIVIPLILSRPLKRFNLPRTVKVPIINLMMFIMIFLSVNSNRGFLIDDVTFAGLILIVAIFRVVTLSVLSHFALKAVKVPNDRRTTMMVMGVWKNTGLSVSMSMLILASTPESVIPCFMSMMVECIWFSIITRRTHEDQTA